MRDAALMALTNGRCNKVSAKLSGLPLLDIDNVRFTRAVESLIPEILDHNSQKHVFLCHPDFLDRIMHKPKQIAKFNEHISFGYNNDAPADSPDMLSAAAAATQQASLEEFGHVLSKGNSNIMLNAPAGYGKSHMIKTVMRPLLVRRYQKQGVWFTASTGIASLGLGEGAGTLHSMAAIGKAAGTAQDIHRDMPDRAKKRWRKVKVSAMCLSFSAMYL